MSAGSRELLANTLIYGFGGAISRLVSIVVLPVLTYYLTPQEFGVIAMLALLGMVLTPLFSLGLGVSIGIHYHNQTAVRDRNAVIWTAFFIFLAGAFILTTLGLLGTNHIRGFLFSENGWADEVRLAIISSAIAIPVQAWQLKLQFESKARAFVLLSICSAVFSAFLVLYFVVTLRRSIGGYFEAIIISQLISLALFTFVAARGSQVVLSGEYAKLLLKSGLPLAPSFIFLFVIQNGARYFLEGSRGLHEVGIYSLGVSIGMVFSIFTTAFIAAWTPFALSYSGKQEQARHDLARVSLQFFVGAGMCVLLFFFFAKPVINIFAAPEYSGAYMIVGMTAASQFLSALFLMALPPVYFAQRVHVVLAVQAISAIVAICLCFLFVPVWGALGAAYAVLIAHLAMLLIQLAWIRCGSVYVRIAYDLRRFLIAGTFIALFAYGSFANPYDEVMDQLMFGVAATLLAMLSLGFLSRSELNNFYESVVRIIRRQ
ncbi:MAG: oligosaccharide flippase family protein [Nitrosomonas sp.]|nr:oligosaccharide flippase family protein [Nitrosomonas sp.]